MYASHTVPRTALRCTTRPVRESPRSSAFFTTTVTIYAALHPPFVPPLGSQDGVHYFSVCPPCLTRTHPAGTKRAFPPPINPPGPTKGSAMHVTPV
jgi:hypothetical protein